MWPPSSRVLERRQPREQHAPRLARVARQRQRALEDVARRQHAQLVAQLARAAAAVEHRDDGVGVQPRIGLQSAEQARQTGAAAEAADVQLAQTHRVDILQLTAWPISRRRARRSNAICARSSATGCRSLVVYASDRQRRAMRDADAGRRRRLNADDLRACAAQVARGTSRSGDAAVLAAHEFERSLDAFPLEFGAILADHVVVSGANPFDGLRVDPADLRRACEVQARSHLLHLREGYLETRGRGDALADLDRAIGGAARRAARERRAARRARQRRPGCGGASRRAIVERAGQPREIAQLVGVTTSASTRRDDCSRRISTPSSASTDYIDGWRRVVTSNVGRRSLVVGAFASCRRCRGWLVCR